MTTPSTDTRCSAPCNNNSHTFCNRIYADLVCSCLCHTSFKQLNVKITTEGNSGYVGRADTRCCNSCSGAAQNYDLSVRVFCRFPSCECHTEQKEGWEADFDDKWNLHTKHSTYDAGIFEYPFVGEEVKSFIRETIAKEVKKERERIADQYGHMNDGCGCCKDTTLERSLRPHKLN